MDEDAAAHATLTALCDPPCLSAAYDPLVIYLDHWSLKSSRTFHSAMEFFAAMIERMTTAAPTPATVLTATFHATHSLPRTRTYSTPRGHSFGLEETKQIQMRRSLQVRLITL